MHYIGIDMQKCSFNMNEKRLSGDRAERN